MKMRLIFETDLHEDKAGVGTIVIAVVAILIIAAVGVGAWYALGQGNGGSHDNPSEEGALFNNPGVGTTLKMSMTQTGSNNMTGTYSVEVVGLGPASSVGSNPVIATWQSADVSGKYDGSDAKIVTSECFVGDDSSFVIPDGAKLIRTEKMNTCDGELEVDVYEYIDGSETETYYVGQADSGKKNLAVYKVDTVYGENKSSYELKEYNLKKNSGYSRQK